MCAVSPELGGFGLGLVFVLAVVLGSVRDQTQGLAQIKQSLSLPLSSILSFLKGNLE